MQAQVTIARGLRAIDAMAWLRPDLARVIAWGLAAGFALIGLTWLLFSEDGVRPTGVPFAADFTAFWTAAREALAGRPADAYDAAVLHRAQIAAFGGVDHGFLAFHYPPTFLLACLPFGLLPRVEAAVLFLGLTALGYGLAIRPLLPRGATAATLFAFPAVLVCLDYGQNGLMSAALLGAGVVALDRRPLLAGVFFGLLSVKPQLGPLIPLALALSGRWRSFGAAAVTTLGLALLATLAFGTAIWPAFLGIVAEARTHLEGMPDYTRQASLFAIARLLGLPPGLAHGVQFLGATLPAVAAVAMVARRRPPGAALGAVMVAAIPFASPYVYEYDMAMLAIPMAWLLGEGARGGFRPGERSALALAFAAPLLSGIPHVLGNAMAFGAGAALLGMVVRRAIKKESRT